jgi:hypothetical protein
MMLDNGGESLAYCVMAAFRTQHEAEEALSRISNPAEQAAPKAEPTAKPITGLTEEEQRKLIGCFFAEDWAVRAALDLLHDFTRALAEKNGLAVQGGE